MPSTRDILKASGMTEDAINALDAKILGGFDTVLSTATAAQEAAELAQRAQQQLYSEQIAPALDGWANEKAQLSAETAFYRTQAESAKSGGFIPKEAPGFTPAARDESGKFVPGGNPVPGSPGFTAADGITAISNATWAFQEHARLFSQPAPDDFETLLKESTAQRMPFRDYVDKKYGFATKRTEIAATKQKQHDEQIEKDTEARIRKEYAEAGGNNPGIRTGLPSQFTKVAAAQAAGQRKDPLSMNAEQRRDHTRQNIQADLTDNAAGTVN